MDTSEVEENLFAVGDAKLHGGMCKKLSDIVCKVLEIFPVLESSRPRSKTGIQALCSLHVALDRTKNLLKHCSSCSKLYLAITGDSLLLKFEKASSDLQESLKNVMDIVPQAVGSQIMSIVSVLEETVFALDELEKKSGDEIILLLQKEKQFSGSSNDTELELFHKAATRLGITSARAALTERRSLKKLIGKARAEEDKKKESVVACLLHLMRKYSKMFRGEIPDDSDSQGSAPSSPTVVEPSDERLKKSDVFEKQLSVATSFTFKRSGLRPGNMPIPPEELRCPISLQLMYDPVIISSGQTYERVCIEKWFSDGHDTCPKTQQQLPHLCLTPNYCVKSFISSWCEQNGVSFPMGPPDSLALNYWRLSLSQPDIRMSGDMAVNSSHLEGAKEVPPEESGVMDENEGNMAENSCDNSSQEDQIDGFEKHRNLLEVLSERKSILEQQAAVEQIRYLLRDDEEARIFMGGNGFTEALINFLTLAVHESNKTAQEIGAMALFNLAVNNNKNKEMMLSAGVIPLLEEMISGDSYEPATALYLNLSCLEHAKTLIGSSKVVPLLIQLLKPSNEKVQCRADALHTLYHLSTHASNIPFLLQAGIVEGVRSLIGSPAEVTWTDRSVAILANAVSGSKQAKEEVMSSPGLIGGLVTVLDNGEPPEQEQAICLLLLLCEGDKKCIHTVLQEGVIPALVSASVNGTQRGKEKAQKLLMLFREHRQRDTSPARLPPIPHSKSEHRTPSKVAPEAKPLPKSSSRRLGRTIAAIWKSKHLLHR